MGDSYHQWNKAQKMALAQAVLRREAHLKRSNLTFKERYELVAIDLQRLPLFTGVALQFPQLQVAFRRHSEKVLKDCGISEEGANLSGLEKDLSSYSNAE